MELFRFLSRSLWAAFAIVVGACSTAAPPGPADHAAPAFHVVIPETGELVAFGAQIRRGVEAALDAANEGRPPAQHIRARFLDDACNTDKATQVARALVESRARVVLGHVCSGGSVPASQIYADAGVPMVTAASSSVALTERGLANVFRVALRADIYAGAAADLVVQRYRHGRLGIVYETADISGKGHADQFARILRERGITPVWARGLVDARDAAQVGDALVAQNLDVVFYGGHYPEQFGALLKASRAAGFKGQFVSNDGAANAKLWPESGGTAQGLLYAFGLDLRETAEAASAVARIRRMGFEPDGFTLNAYAATEIIVQGVRQSPGDGAAILQRLRTQAFPTAIGAVSFDAKGDLKRPRVAIYRWDNGKTVVDAFQPAAANGL